MTVLHSFLEEPGMGEGNDRHTGLFTIIWRGKSEEREYRGEREAGDSDASARKAWCDSACGDAKHTVRRMVLHTMAHGDD